MIFVLLLINLLYVYCYKVNDDMFLFKITKCDESYLFMPIYYFLYGFGFDY